MNVKTARVICPKCNKGGFALLNGKEVCTVCGEPMTDYIIKAELDRAWANYKLLEGGNFDKFIVFKNEDIEKYTGNLSEATLRKTAELIESGRMKDGKSTGNTYLVINTDESYAGEVIEILKRNGHWD